MESVCKTVDMVQNLKCCVLRKTMQKVSYYIIFFDTIFASLYKENTIRGFIFLFLADDKFFLSQISCPDETAIMGKTECANACKDLKIPVSEKAIYDGFPCYRSGRGKCRQNGKHGARALKVCQHKTI